MGEKKLLQIFLTTCSVVLLVLFTACMNKKYKGKGKEPEKEIVFDISKGPDIGKVPEGGIANCCQDGGKLPVEDLILYYPMDDLPDTLQNGIVVKDFSGKGNHGKFVKGNIIDTTDSGTVYTTSLSTDGIVGKGLYISKYDYIAILDSIANEAFDFDTGSFTWSMWVKPTEDGPHNGFKNQVWFGAQTVEAGIGGGTHMWLGLTKGASQGLIWQLRAVNKDEIWSQGKYQHTALNSEELANAWHHIVAVKDGHENSDISLYIDGKEVDQYRFGKDTISNESTVEMSNDYIFSKIDCFYLGKFPVSDSFNSTFTMDEVSIWKRALSKSEVEMVYHRQKPN